MCLGALLACMSLQHTCMQRIQRPEKGPGLLGTGVPEGFEKPCGCWVLKYLGSTAKPI